MRDVAREAGVSIATVSHVLNNTRFVSDGLRARVEAAMEELSYQPNVLARGLRSGQTETVGLIVPDNSNPFFAEVARMIETEGFDHGYSVVLCNSDNSLEKEGAYVDVLIAKHVDGVIFIASGDDQRHLQDLDRRGIPVVVADRDIPEALADVVLVDNESGGYEATRYLLDMGHRRIACICGPTSLATSAERLEGYKRALTEAGVEVREDFIVPADFRYSGGEAAAAELLDAVEPPFAIFAFNDVMAIGALRAIRAVGLRVPEDISVVGFDDIHLAKAMSPALTTVAQPVKEMAEETVDLLLERIHTKDDAKSCQRIILKPHLVIRNSCGAPEGQDEG
jgi:LacI family transcriptional regulator